MRRARTILALIVLFAGAALVALYACSRAVTDATLTSQFLFWIPGPALLIPAGAAAALGAWLLRVPRTYDETRPPRRRRVAARLILFFWLACAGFETLVHDRLYRAFLSPPPPPARTISVFHWNMSGPDNANWPRFMERIPTAPPADLILLSNPIWSERFNWLPESLGAPYTFTRAGPISIVSRFPILASGAISLNLDGIAEDSGRHEEHDIIAPEADAWLSQFFGRRLKTRREPGAAFFATLDTAAVLGRPITVWILDLPSDPRLHRPAVTSSAAARIAELASTPLAFPTPDLIVGDFNIPRASGSLGALNRGYPHAFDQSGSGVSGSFPTERPLWHIDHAFVAPGLRARAYRLINPGLPGHCQQSFELFDPGK